MDNLQQRAELSVMLSNIWHSGFDEAEKEFPSLKTRDNIVADVLERIVSLIQGQQKGQ